MPCSQNAPFKNSISNAMLLIKRKKICSKTLQACNEPLGLIPERMMMMMMMTTTITMMMTTTITMTMMTGLNKIKRLAEH
jgi:hypothetical protein